MSGLILPLSSSQSLVFLLNSRLGHFSAAYRSRHPFSRSYRVILPSSLAMSHSSTLGFSPRLPVSVYGTGSYNFIQLEVFLGSLITSTIHAAVALWYYQVQLTRRIFLPGQYLPPSTYYSVSTRDFHSSVTPSLDIASIGILTDCPSTIPFGFALGPD